MHVFEIAAGTASIVGLGFSIWAALAAQAARSAARQATRVARRSSADEDFARLGQLGEEFLIYLQAGDVPSAVVRGRDLLASTQEVGQRWKRFLPEGANSALASACELTGDALLALESQGLPAASAEKMRLLRVAQQVLQVLKNESAKLTSSIEESEE